MSYYRQGGDPDDKVWLVICLALLLLLASFFWSEANAQDYYDGEPRILGDKYRYYYDPNCPNYILNSIDDSIDRLDTLEPTRVAISYSKNNPDDRRSVIFCDSGEPRADDSVRIFDYEYQTVVEQLTAPSNLVIGTAYVTFVPKNGAIIDCDIRINTDLTNVINIGPVMTHEVGHCHGLAHVYNEPLSIMSPTIKLFPRIHIREKIMLSRLYDKCKTEVDWLFNFWVVVGGYRARWDVGTIFPWAAYNPDGKFEGIEESGCEPVSFAN